MNAKVTIEYTVKNVCNPSDYGKRNGRFRTFGDVVRYIIKNEGIHGIAEDKYKVRSVSILRQ